MSAKELERMSKRIDDLEKTMAMIKTSGAWARALTILLVPSLLVAIYYGIAMYTSQAAYNETMHDLSRSHARALATIQSNQAEIILLRAEGDAVEDDVEGLERRVERAERRVWAMDGLERSRSERRP